MPDSPSQVSVTPMMLRSFDEIKLLKADILFHNEQALSRQALIFQTNGPGFKLMSPERIKMLDHQGLTFLKQCIIVLYCIVYLYSANISIYYRTQSAI